MLRKTTILLLSLQAILRYAVCKLGMKVVMNKREDVKKVVHLLIGVPLLPPQDAKAAIQVIDTHQVIFNGSD